MRQRQGAVGGSEQLGTEKCLPAFRLCEGVLFSWKIVSWKSLKVSFKQQKNQNTAFLCIVFVCCCSLLIVQKHGRWEGGTSFQPCRGPAKGCRMLFVFSKQPFR